MTVRASARTRAWRWWRVRGMRLGNGIERHQRYEQ
jgi:hypothetical protein